MGKVLTTQEKLNRIETIRDKKIAIRCSESNKEELLELLKYSGTCFFSSTGD